MQTDPNLANYRFDPASGRIVLLDFGATRAFPAAFVETCRGLARAALLGDAVAVERGLVAAGYLDAHTDQALRAAIVETFLAATDALRTGGVYDFADAGLLDDLRERAEALAATGAIPAVPPMDALFLQRKLGGIYLLARRLGATVDVGARLAAHL